MATSTTKAADKKVADKTTKAAETKAVVKTEAKAEVKTEAKKEVAPKAAPAKKAEAKKAPAKKATTTAKKAPAKKAVEATFDSIFAAINSNAKKAKFTSNFIAAQITLTGNVESQPLYVKVDSKKAEVAPYNYNDSSFVMNADAEAMAAVLNGKKTIFDAIAEGKIAIYGDASMAVLFVKAMF